jgi:hypothetical protein
MRFAFGGQPDAGLDAPARAATPSLGRPCAALIYTCNRAHLDPDEATCALPRPGTDLLHRFDPFEQFIEQI